MKLRNKFLVLLLAVVFVFSMFAMTACEDAPETTEASITLSKTSVSLVVGGENKKATINATVKGTKDKPQWSIGDTAVATIQYQGNTCEITAVAEGTTSVTAKVGKKTATCTVTVDPAPKPAITIALDKTELSLTKGDEATEVTATLTNAEDGDTVTWSLANGGDAVVTITPNGNKVSVRPIAVGTTKLTAKIGEVTKTIDITVVKAPVSLTLDKEKVELEYDPDAEEAATATVTATVANTDENVEWSINSDIAEITPSEDGLTCTVTAAGVGRATLTATVDGKTATIPVIIAPAEGVVVEGELSISVEEKEPILEKGKTLDISATVKGSVVEPTWSVNKEGIVELSATTGEEVTLTAIGEGEVRLTVTIGEGDKETVTLDLVVYSLEVDKTAVELILDPEDADNNSATITATYEPHDVSSLFNWVVAEDDAVITATVNGAAIAVTAKDLGTTTVIAKLGETEKIVTITVKAPITVTASQNSLTFKEGGDAKTVLVTVTGTDEEVELGISDEDVVTVTKSYVDGHYELTITPGSVGQSTIYVNVGGKYAMITVTVEGIPEITFTATDTFGYEDGIVVWHKAIFDSNPDITTDTTVEATATVNGNPVETEVNLPAAIEVHVKVPGTIYDDVVINYTFKNGDEVVATAQLNYTGVKELIISDNEKSVSLGTTAEISVIKINGSENTDGKQIVWTIEDTEGEGIATIPENSTGASVVVTAVKEGKATLTCTVGEGDDAMITTCVITVVEGDVGGDDGPTNVSGKLLKNNTYPGGSLGQCINIRYDCSASADAAILEQISSVEVTAKKGNVETASAVAQNYKDATNYYVHVSVDGDWNNYDYSFTISYKNAAGKVIAKGTYVEAAPTGISIPSTANIELGENNAAATFEVEVSGTGAAATALANVTWTLTGGEGYATIPEDSTGATVTITATTATPEDATVTLKATLEIDGKTYESTCTVKVFAKGDNKGEELTATYSRKYGDNYALFTLSKALTKGDDFDTYKVNGTQYGVQHYIADPSPTFQFYIGADNYETGSKVKIEFYKGEKLVYWFEAEVGA